MAVTSDELQMAIEDLRLAGRAVAIHVSLRSFPRIDGGPATLVDAFLTKGCTVLGATMANEAFADYAAHDASGPWPGETDIYDAARTEVDPWVGAIPARIAARPDRVRCALPAGTFSAVGPLAADLIAAETDADAYGPLRALASLGGAAVLMGVGLDRLTMLHLAEIEAGRRPFVHWARGADESEVRFFGGKCSLGFENLAPALTPFERRTTVGTSPWRCFDAAGAPSITHCGRDCAECDDAIAGGPLD